MSGKVITEDIHKLGYTLFLLIHTLGPHENLSQRRALCLPA